MTIHSYYNHKCPKCGVEYIAFKKGIKCPQCNADPKEVYPIAKEALSAWRYHKKMYGSGVPPVFVILSSGDKYIYISAVFLDRYNNEKPRDDEKYIKEFVEKVKCEEYMKQHFAQYLEHLLRLFKMTKSPIT